jgi:hypothetical protein
MKIVTLEEVKKLSHKIDFDLEDIEYENALGKSFKDFWELLALCNVGIDRDGEFYLK